MSRNRRGRALRPADLARAGGLVWRALKPGGRPGRDRRWSAGTLVMVLVAGVLLTLTASTAGGTSLRVDEEIGLDELIPRRNAQVIDLEEQASTLRDEVSELTAGLADDEDVAAATERAEEYLAPAGLTAVHGPGLVVSLNDAERDEGESPPGATVDDLVVHQQDVQAVVNALWAGGAEAMTIMNVRVISTSAVRCVGNTLLLHGKVYSPPFEIAAIGDNVSMSNALAAAPGVRAFVAAADEFGLGYRENEAFDIQMPAYDGPLNLINAEVPR